MDFTWAAVGAAHAGAARRRRERYLRYARMSVAMALAEATHHTAPRGQKTARARGEERDELYDAKGLMTHPPTRSAPLVEVRPQGRVQRHSVEQRIEHTPYVQILDALVPQMVEQLVDFFKNLDVEVPAQVIEVPKISQDIVPQRSADLVPQIVEQLVEVPTIVSYSSLQRDVEHRVDIPVPGRGGRIAGLQGSSSGQSSGPPGFPGSPAAQAWISARLLEQMLDCIPDPGHSSSSSSHRPAGISEDTDEPGDGVFRTFPPGKKSAEVAGQVSADLPRHVSSWTPAAYVHPP